MSTFSYRFSSIHPYPKSKVSRTKSMDPSFTSMSSVSRRMEVSETSSEVSSEGAHFLTTDATGGYVYKY